MKTPTGLSTQEVQKQRKKYGYNEIPEKVIPMYIKLLKKFSGPIPWMIEAAAILSAVLRRWEDFFIIATLLLVNVLLDFKQEKSALNAIQTLKKNLARKALVLRNGNFIKIDAKLLVPGDIIKVRLGDIIPADAKLTNGKYLQVDQSTLTGESIPKNKKIGDVIYANTIVKMGEMIAEVEKIGLETFLGKSISLVSKAEDNQESHFQKAIIKVGNFLIILTLTLATIILIVSTFRGDNIFETLQFILVLIVASIPVALPAVMSVTMAVGAVAIAKRKAIVTNLPVTEELAGIDTLCTDKTGTLTQNKMSVNNPIIYNNFTIKELFTFASLASQIENSDPIEIPIFSYLQNNFPNINLKKYKLQKFYPFDPITKRSKAILLLDKQLITVIKGAPQVIANRYSDKKTAKLLLNDVEELAKKGFRTLAVSVQLGDGSPKCVGLIPLYDPPRNDSAKMIEKVKSMGIDIKMLTGDNDSIARQISKMLNIGNKILNLSKLRKNIFGNNPLKTNPSILINKTNGFSQVLPEDKYLIISNLQKHNHIVAMTGDGVNDAPALKKADVGIAVSGATDAARASADLVLLSPGLSVIYHAIHIAKRTFERMKSYAIFRIAETTRIILFMFLSIIIFNMYPITAVMIVILALLSDIPVMMIAYDNVVANKKPARWDLKEVLTIASILGIAGVISSFTLFYLLYTNHYPLALIQTLIFVKLDVAGHSTLYLTRAGKYHFWHKPYPSLKFFIPAFGSRIIGTLIAVYGIFMQPIGWKYAGYIWLYAIAWWIFNDYVKVIAYKILDKRKG